MANRSGNCRPSGRAGTVCMTMIELLTTAEMAEADRLTIAAGTSGIAAHGKCRPRGGRCGGGPPCCRAVAVVVVAGPGNNGGDGFVAARVLHGARLCRARRSWSASRAGSRAMPPLAAGRWSGPVEAASPAGLADRRAIVVDALFGAGLDRPVEGAARDDRGDECSGAPVDRRGSAERHQWNERGGHGCAVKAGETVTLLSPQGRPSPAAGPAALRRASKSPISASGAACSSAIKPRTFLNAPRAVGEPLSDPARRMGTNMRAAMPWWCRAAFHDRRGAACGARRAARGRRAGDHCFARATRSPSMRPRAWPSWCGRSTAPTNSPPSWPTPAQCGGAGPGRRGRTGDAGAWCAPRWRPTARPCSTPMP